MPDIDVYKLARKFSANLHLVLTEEQMGQVVDRNSEEENPNICHTHDFCDPNQVIIDTLGELGVPNYGPNENAALDALIAAAWETAKECDFDDEAIQADQHYDEEME
jgi:hypothetical protein